MRGVRLSQRDVGEDAARGGDRGRWCRRATGRLLGIGHRGGRRTPPTPRRRRSRSLRESEARPTSSWLMFRGAGVLTLSQRRRSSSPPGVRRAQTEPRRPRARLPGTGPDTPVSRIPVQRRTFMVPHASLPAGLASSAGRSRPAAIASVTTTRRRRGCRTYAASAAECAASARPRWSNVEQCGDVTARDLPRRPADPAPPSRRLHPVRTASFVLAAAVPDEREVAVMTSDGVGPTDGSITRRLAARAARSA